ncbi:hypothetical protein [Streptomyces sp. NPDC048603]|uniref:hypothetical protein n=1 Tax=Streptomyces sp. NPDC048603 TaxID=3365577 RepID=UPI00371E602C
MITARSRSRASSGRSAAVLLRLLGLCLIVVGFLCAHAPDAGSASAHGHVATAGAVVAPQGHGPAHPAHECSAATAPQTLPVDPAHPAHPPRAAAADTAPEAAPRGVAHPVADGSGAALPGGRTTGVLRV